MSASNLQRIGAAMKAARIEAGREQSELAAALGVSQANISKIEAGKVKPSIVQALQWALACGMPLGVLADRIAARILEG